LIEIAPPRQLRRSTTYFIMTTYIVSYEFKERLADDVYLQFRNELWACGTPTDFVDAIYQFDCSWLILRSELPVSDIGKRLRPFLRPADKLLIAQVAQNRWYGLEPNETAIACFGHGRIPDA
jgi:hypothetical protein